MNLRKKVKRGSIEHIEPKDFNFSMYLKRLEIQGFKSFAEKVSLEFLPFKNGKNSITAIVGPNGSGKSNISDAIRWVLGEQSMKQLRGKKSEDIIFSGSEHKAQLGMASVMMVLDNTDGRIPLEYEEIVIGRRLYRSGESEYILNENPVKLIDLQLMLAKAQFGNGSYAVIGQGTIDRLLLQSPQERKDFFDEASGIREFQMKRHQANLKLIRTKEHLDQAEMIAQEIEPRLKTLSRQVKKLEERQTIEVALRELQEKYYVTLYQTHNTEANEFRTKIQSSSEQVDAKQKNLLSLQEELATLAREESRSEIFDKLQSSYQELLKEKNDREREKIILQGKMQTEYGKVGQQQVGWLEGKITELKERVETYSTQVKNEEKTRATLQSGILEHEEKIRSLSDARAKIRSRMNQLEWERTNVNHEQSLFQVMGLTAVQGILERKKEFGEVYGMVVQLGEADKRYELALDVAGGNYLSSLIVENETVARHCIEYLRQEKLGVATFLPLTTIRPRADERIRDFLLHPGVHGIASELVHFDKTFQNIFDFVFGSTLVVEDAAVAKDVGVGRVRMVTLEGDIFERNGSIRGGFRARRTTGVSFTNHSLSLHSDSRDYETEIQELSEELQRIEKNFEFSSEELRNKQSEIKLITEKLSLVKGEKNTLLEELSRFEQDYALSTMSPDMFGNIMVQMKKEKQFVEKQIEVIETSIQEKASEIEAFQKEEEQKRQRVFHLQDLMQSAQMELNTLLTSQHENQIQLTRLETKLEDLNEEIMTEMRVTLHSVLERGITPFTAQEIPGKEAQIQKYKYTLSLIGGIDEEVIQEYHDTKERYEGLSLQLNDLKKAYDDLQTLIAELDDVMKKRRDKAFKDIRKEFERYFKILFDGGNAELIELYEEDKPQNEESELEISEEIPLEEVEGKEKKKKILGGIDVIANPPGKKIKNIQALSGGERTLTSIALMCAILRINPSPFIVLDEIEAALDEANTLRVVNILKELSEQSQFILITHNRVTMHAADALYGVTMGVDGMSRLLSVKLDQLAVPSEA